MESPKNWREIPAEIIEDVIRKHNHGKFPPKITELVDLLGRYDYEVYEPPDDTFVTAVTFHRKRIVYLPQLRPRWRLLMLMHETAEVLLRSTCAQEFHFHQGWEDEHHAVAHLTSRRMEKRMQQVLQPLLQQEADLEEALLWLRGEIEAQKQQFRDWMAQMDAHLDNLPPMPDGNNVQMLIEDYNRQAACLKDVRSRIRYCF